MVTWLVLFPYLLSTLLLVLLGALLVMLGANCRASSTKGEQRRVARLQASRLWAVVVILTELVVVFVFLNRTNLGTDLGHQPLLIYLLLLVIPALIAVFEFQQRAEDRWAACACAVLVVALMGSMACLSPAAPWTAFFQPQSAEQRMCACR